MTNRLWLVGLVVCAVSLSLSSTEVLAQKDKDNKITGQWKGRWKNSLGESDKSSLEVKEVRAGKFSGIWDTSYVIKDGNHQGDKIAFNTTQEGRTYDVTGKLSKDGDTLTLEYTVTYKEKGKTKSYTGTATLKRQ